MVQTAEVGSLWGQKLTTTTAFQNSVFWFWYMLGFTYSQIILAAQANWTANIQTLEALTISDASFHVIMFR